MSVIERMQAAAVARSAGVRSPGDRPSQRRSAQGDTGMGVVRAPSTLTVRDAGEGPASGLLTFDGYASIVERGYEMWDAFGPYTETVAATAFDETLAMQGLDVPLVLAHDDLRRIARTTNGTLFLSMNEQGLRVHAPALDPADADVAYITPKVRSGLIDEMSFRFCIDSGSWSPDYTAYRIEKVNIHRGDVAICGYGANPYTAGATIRSTATTPQMSRLIITDDDVTGRTARR